MEYDFKEIEKKWQKYWTEEKTYKVEVNSEKPKFYVLDMFPYPSGAGLHVGHPLGYIASDIYSRYKTLKGFNVLHPMGYDAYGLPAEQYAIQTGQHPAITTETNITRYRQQLNKIGFSYDWDREVRTCEPEYYKWTQWAFIQMFNHYFNIDSQKAESIESLVTQFELSGNGKVNAACSETEMFTADEWKVFTDIEKQTVLLNYRLAYLADTMVNWCPKLGTVLANDEVKDGASVRGGHPVEQKKMRQWSLRVSAYAKRLLDGLDNLEWTDSLKEIQKNWIGRSVGAEVNFGVKGSELKMEIFTTRPDTIFGVTFMVLAPESDLVKELTTPDCQANIDAYIEATSKRTERERLADVKTVSGAFTGAYAVHPFTGEEIPVWVSDYVLAGYGTGAIMAVPAHDSRDYAFAKHFDLPIVQVVSGGDISEESYDAKEGQSMNSDFLNGLDVKDAIVKANEEVEARGLGKKKINYRLRDAIFSRQRYWGEPFPVYFKDGMPQMMDLDKLPLELPEIDKYLPTESGEPPLGRAKDWITEDGYPIELNTMPGFAGSSAYYLRYMDPRNNEALVSAEANEYWQDVDLYIGGTEHATGHLIYSRFWNKFLFDINEVCKDEPFRKLINQGMIQGRSNFVYRDKKSNKYVSHGLIEEYDTTAIHVDVNIVKNDVLDLEAFKNWMPEYKNAEFILEDGKYHCGWAVEKMSKSMFNVVNPDVIVEEYGADTLRLYEMFLGPLEAHKPWDTNGIDGVHKFLKKLWRLFHNEAGEFELASSESTQDELKVLHKTIKKIQDDIERFSFNTSVSAFMICVNELYTLKCNNKAILENLLVILAPFAPHVSEELWALCGNTTSITKADFPEFNESFVQENIHKYPVSFNGKMRFILELPVNLSRDEIEKEVLSLEKSQKWIDGKTPKKIIIVPNKIINIVV
ncbi:leucine--tRNA ligase [Labilibaculum euxinus]|uniref:Leucine--tRNA ligase n=1 Tax=Labilibaculum euxinus TaxID=2686357 RepID=A0A7M4D9H6_9BACT|nr:leucine--tRNA ligase [Labilibaculum euxinus]MUP39305.1 leucine--tRNA ligase [Labilibaculum euxinus]MVB08510.1 leucine--tRNA ligase [Labilibaculum euxinus]